MLNFSIFYLYMYPPILYICRFFHRFFTSKLVSIRHLIHTNQQTYSRSRRQHFKMSTAFYLFFLKPLIRVSDWAVFCGLYKIRSIEFHWAFVVVDPQRLNEIVERTIWDLLLSFLYRHIRRDIQRVHIIHRSLCIFSSSFYFFFLSMLKRELT